MKAGILQFTPVFGDVETNIRRVMDMVTRAVDDDTKPDLLVLPEMALTGYAFESREQLAEVATGSMEGRTAAMAQEIARMTGGHVVVGYPEPAGGVFYNSAMVAGPDGVVGVYRKTHLFGAEKDLFLPGDTGLVVFDLSGVRVGVMICFDWFFPESARTLALRGAQVIAHPANLVLPYCQRAMFARAVENRVYTITANRCGKERFRDTELTFTGQSIAYSPKGEILAQGPQEGDVLLAFDIDPTESDGLKRMTSRNFLFDDLRPSMYYFADMK